MNMPFPLASMGAIFLCGALGHALDPKMSIGMLTAIWLLISSGMLGYALDLIRK